MLADYLNFFKDIFVNQPFNLFDLIILGLFALYIFEDISFGLIASSISLMSTIVSFFIGLAFYPYLSSLILQIFDFPKGIADAISFLIITSLSFFIISFALSALRKKYIDIKIPKNVDRIGGGICGAISFFFIVSFAVSLLLSFPTSSVIRNSIKDSVTGGLFTNNTQIINHAVRQVFGGAIEDTINFLTVKPGTNQSVNLNFKTTTAEIDTESEEQMLALVNRERAKVDLAPLEMDQNSQELARSYADDMLSRGFFSHYTPEGLSPFDRMAAAGIGYQYAGENLAFAPDVIIAMNGLMKSKGHRENILNPDFGKVGIGVLDAGIYGKMFVQEFTD